MDVSEASTFNVDGYALDENIFEKIMDLDDKVYKNYKFSNFITKNCGVKKRIIRADNMYHIRIE